MPRRRHPRAAVGALAWLGAAAIAGTVAWNAVSVLADDGPRTGLLTQSEVTAALAETRASAATATAATAPPTGSPTASTTPTPSAQPTAEPEPAPSASPSPEPSTTAPPPAPAPTAVAATWQLTGGTVSVECTGSRISLLFATPQDGWTVEVGARGPETVEVELHRPEDETKLTARCSDGAPTRTVETDQESHEEDD